MSNFSITGGANREARPWMCDLCGVHIDAEGIGLHKAHHVLISTPAPLPEPDYWLYTILAVMVLIYFFS